MPASAAASVNDTRAAFERFPWIASLILAQPNIFCSVPETRVFKPDTEDSLFAETFKTTRTIRSCLVVCQRPSQAVDQVPKIDVLFELGDGMNGHPKVLHGGIVATLIDEAMGFLGAINDEWQLMSTVWKAERDESMKRQAHPNFTAELKIRYRRPVMAPGVLVVTITYIKSEGRRRWVNAEIKQCQNGEGGFEGERVVCATGEALFMAPRSRENKM